MMQDLGDRLLRAGVVTRAQLARASDGEAPPGGRLVANLVSEGVWEDAIAGYLVATGFGPLQHVPATAASDSSLADTVPAEHARAMRVAPMARRGSTVLLAMADPSDVAELDRLRARTTADLVPVLVRHGEVARLVEAMYGDSPVAPGGAPPDPEEDDAVALPLIRAKPASPAAEEPPPSPEPAPPEPAPPEPAQAEQAPSEPAQTEQAPPESAQPEPAQAEQADTWAATPPKPPPDIEPQLEALATVTDRDAAIDLACETLLGVARAAWFMSLRKDSLRGVRGKGPLSNDVVRDLTVPVDADSRAADVAQRGQPYDGPLGSSPADAAFVTAASARGSRMVLHPVFVEERLIGVLCADEVTHGEQGAEQVRRLADTMGEAFRRMLLEAKAKRN